MKRGDVVIVDWPLSKPQGQKPSKPRPAVVVQNDRDNARLTNTILVMITSVTRRSGEPTQLLIEISSPDGALTGLRQDSVVNCANLLTIEKAEVLHTIGHMSPALMKQIDTCLRAALGLP
jgi:mRNA interferase MazF